MSKLINKKEAPEIAEMFLFKDNKDTHVDKDSEETLVKYGYDRFVPIKFKLAYITLWLPNNINDRIFHSIGDQTEISVKELI